MINITITVSDVNTVLQYFTHIKLQRAVDYDFTSGVTTFSNIPIQAGVTTYNYNDVSGLSTHWYRSKYINTSTLLESDWSDPERGELVSYFPGATYPVEESYSPTERTIIDNIRLYIGDTKRVSRDYVNSCYNNVMGDSYTYILSERGWPLRVRMTTASGLQEFTNETNPIVYDYHYVVFSGAQNTITNSTVLDVWYEIFTWSDREIYEAYSKIGTVPGMTSTYVTDEMLQLYCAINILKSEMQRFARESAVRVDDGDTSYNPTPAIEARRLVVENLEGRLKDLVKRYGLKNIEGIRIE